MGKLKEKPRKERTCRCCSRRIQQGDPHGTCWEHLGEFHICNKCADLKPFRGFPSFQEYLSECWGSDKSLDNPGSGASEAVSTQIQATTSKTDKNGGTEVTGEDESEAARKVAQSSQDGGIHAADTLGVDKSQDVVQEDKSEPELVITHVERRSSDGSEKDEDDGDYEDVFAGAKGRKVFNMFRAFEEEQSSHFSNFKREIHQELRDTLVAINESISKITGKTDKSVSLSNNADNGEDSDNTFGHDNDYNSIVYDEDMPDKPSQFEERVRTLDRPVSAVADKQQEIVVENGAKTIKLALNLNLNDKEKDDRKDKKTEKEEDFDKKSLPLSKVVQACVPTSAYRSFFCDKAVMDLRKEKEDVSSMAANWADACFDSKVPDKTKFHEGMWAFIAAADEEVYKSAMVPGVKEASNESATKTSVRFPRFPVPPEDGKKWEELVNDVLTSKKDNNQLPSVLAISVNKNYQFIDKDFQKLGMQPEIDLFVEEQCSYAGKKVPQLDKNSLAFRTAEGTKLQHRIIVFMRAALTAMKKQQCLQKPANEDNEEGRDFISMAVTALEQATSDLRTVTARLHANGLRAVRRNVLEKTDLGISDKDFLTRAKAVPAKALFANRAPGFSEELKKEDQLKEARVAVSRAEKRKKETQTYHQNQKKPRYDDYRKDASRGRERSNFFGSSREKFRQSFRDFSGRSRGDSRGGRGGRGGSRGGRPWNGGQGFSRRK